MKVRVKHGRFRMSFWIPNGFLGFALKCYAKHERKILKNKDVKVNAVDGKDIKKIAQELKKAKKIHGNLELVSVKSAEGEIVKIVL